MNAADQQLAQGAPEVGIEFDAVVVPFQTMFDEACEAAPAEYWAKDGVHPSPAGHWLMAETWLLAVRGEQADGSDD